MTIFSHPRAVSDAVGSETTRATDIRRWAIVRLILGILQMFGAVFSLTLIVWLGVMPLTLAAVIGTGVVTGVSMFLFQVLKRGQPPMAQSKSENRAR